MVTLTVFVRQAGYLLWTCAIFFLEGGNFSLFPSLVAQLFGSLNSGANYGIVFAMVNSANVVAIAVLSGFDLPVSPLSQLLGAMTISGVALLLFLPRPSRTVVKKV
jgi:hypothetical protein